MNYILLDLEWNNAYCKKSGGFVNEIIEFGAVKLDEQFRELERFDQMVRSSLTKNLTGRFRELTGITNEQMREGIPFADALAAYRKWAGEDTVTLTWSDSDLRTLYDNCQLFTDSERNARIGKYVDLQRYFQYELSLLGKGSKNQISLSNAAALFNIDIGDQTLHHAVDDSSIAASILRRCYCKEHFEPFICDTDAEEFYQKLRFKAYYIHDLNSPLIDKSKLSFSCPVCKKKAKRIKAWKYKIPWFQSCFSCQNCGKTFQAGVSFKRCFDHTVTRKKLFPEKAKAEKEIPKTAHKQCPPVKQ